MMKRMWKVIAVIGFSIILVTAQGYALPTEVIDLGDESIEQVQIGYTNNPELENLEYWFAQNGVTNEDGSAINPLSDQRQDELFYTDVEREYEVEYLGLGYASYHSPFGVFTYEGNPFEDFNAAHMNYMDPLFVQNEVEPNTQYNFSIGANTYFGFYLLPDGDTPSVTTMVDANQPVSSELVQNPEEYTPNLDHTIFFDTNKGYTIAFEDIIGGGDADYEDLVVNFAPTDGSDFASTPEPASMIMLGLGLIGLAGLGRKQFMN